jgi:hypothetical protein
MTSGEKDKGSKRSEDELLIQFVDPETGAEDPLTWIMPRPTIRPEDLEDFDKQEDDTRST